MSRTRSILKSIPVAVCLVALPQLAQADTTVTFPSSGDDWAFNFYPYMFFEGDQVSGTRYVDPLDIEGVSFSISADAELLFCETQVDFYVDDTLVGEWMIEPVTAEAQFSRVDVPLSASGGRDFTLTLVRTTPTTDDCGSVILDEDVGTVTFVGTGSSNATDDDGDGFDTDTDCDDTDAAIYPGADEPCDGVDNDCDLEIDEEGTSTFFIDQDGDGVGDEAMSLVTCEPPDGYVSAKGDCDDADPQIYPGADETCDDADNDCDSIVDEEAGTVWFRDADRDEFGDDGDAVQSCERPSGYVESPGDCDDSTGAVHPAASEVCDDRDNNCNGIIDDRDVDGDGFYAEACGGDDCNDNRADVNPGAEEIPGDLTDNDCDDVVDEEPTTGCPSEGRGPEGAGLMWLGLLGMLGVLRKRGGGQA